ncbi:unnamed protein product [Oikopleura dioica]|uniref:Uncharacterized protein n=1 Tax=Oikopleura dioica TaxID=34765 RepID=E4XFS3_OIKDI|nr:unnamed protein product [Oikopleura dioica]
MMRTVLTLLSLSSSLPVSEDEIIGTTAATPDLPDFLFKHFGEPPLTDSQMLNILIGSTAIPSELLTEQPQIDVFTTPATVDLATEQIFKEQEIDLPKQVVKVEIIEEIEKEVFQQGSDVLALQSLLSLMLPLLVVLY